MERDSILIYQTADGRMTVDVILENETVWLTQDQMGQLFGVKRPAITKRLSNIFKSMELNKDSVSSILEHTARDDKIYKTAFYNLDAIYRSDIELIQKMLLASASGRMEF